jgi:hypothetical protein
MASFAAGEASAGHGAHEIERVIDGDVLQGVGDRLDEVFLADGGHGGSSFHRREATLEAGLGVREMRPAKYGPGGRGGKADKMIRFFNTDA